MIDGETNGEKPDLLVLLKRDHCVIATLLDRLEDKDTTYRRKLLDELQRELEAYSSLEEEILYPELERNEALKALTLEAKRERNEIAELLDELEGVSHEDEAWVSQLRALKEKIERHLQREESEIFALLMDELDEVELATLTAKVASHHKPRCEAA